MKIAKIRDVKTPTTAHATDAGIDFFMPEFEPEFMYDFKAKNPEIIHKLRLKYDFKAKNPDRERYITYDRIMVPPQMSVLIPSGIKINVPAGQAAIFFNKSGMATKHQLIAGGCVIDEDYQGEVHLNFINTGKEAVKLVPGQKVLQLILIPICSESTEEVAEKDLYDEVTDRADGGFGSSDK